MLILFGVARLLFLIIDILAHIHEDIHIVVFHEKDVGDTPLTVLQLNYSWEEQHQGALLTEDIVTKLDEMCEGK